MPLLLDLCIIPIALGMIGSLILFTDNYVICLLYTSDDADDSLGVDLGGRRIIKKKIF